MYTKYICIYIYHIQTTLDSFSSPRTQARLYRVGQEPQASLCLGSIAQVKIPGRWVSKVEHEIPFPKYAPWGCHFYLQNIKTGPSLG